MSKPVPPCKIKDCFRPSNVGLVLFEDSSLTGYCHDHARRVFRELGKGAIDAR